jgi:hypothetical protein
MQFSFQRVLRKASQAHIQNLGHAGAAIRLAARRSIRSRKGPSPAGQPPNTHTRRLPRAILYAVESERGIVVIGPSVELAGTVGRAHEHGGRYKREVYAPRPFMGPALAAVAPRLPRLWAGSVR